MHYFIVNPYSSSGRGRLVWEKLREHLAHIPHEAFLTEYPGHAAHLAAQISGCHPGCTLVAVGGDGTVNEVVNGIVSLKNTTLGYIPTGSGNDFARSLCLPANPLKALQTVLHSSARKAVDVGLLSSSGKNRRFLVSSGFGFDAAICHRKLQNKMKLGKLIYVGIALKQILLYKPDSLALQLDQKKTVYYPKAYFAAIMNQPYEGGGFCFCPQALGSDGLFHICVVESIPRLKILLLLPTVYWGGHTRFKGIHILKASQLTVASNRPLPVHCDGESFQFRQHASLSFLPDRLSVITPEKD